MNEFVKTGLFAGGAVAMALIAALSSPGAIEPVFFSDVGEEFFPEFTDPARAVSLEVWEFDSDTGEAVPFSVEQRDGKWTIPSHHDYPADAKDRMAEAAGLVIGLRKMAVRSDNRSDHVAFGVVDPSEQTLELEGRGKRITFKDSAGTVLADLIIGKKVEGKTDQSYVRLPGKKRTYVAEIKAELSTKFEDWIDRDVLESGTLNITKVVFDNYSVDEERGTLLRGDKVVLVKDASKWKVEGLADGEETDQDKARGVSDALRAIKIVGVRPKPEGLTAQLEAAQGMKRAMLSQMLSRRGYFLSQGKLYSNEGDLIVENKNGLVYTLKFGEIVYGRGNVVTSGEEDTARKRIVDPKSGEDTKEAEEKEGSHRYLMITVHFDESLLEKPEGTPLAQEQLDKRGQARQQMEKIVAAVESYKSANEGNLPATLADLTSGDAPQLEKLELDPWQHDYMFETMEEGFRVISLGEDGAVGGQGPAEDMASDAWVREDELNRIAADHKRYAEKVEQGKKDAAKVSSRLGAWYYVIDADSFGKLKLGRSDLVKAVEAEPDAAAAVPESGIDGGK